MSLPRWLRKTIFWSHLMVGLTAGLIILLLAVTGFLLAYERQILEWRDGMEVTVPAGGHAVPLEELVSRVVQAHHGPPLSGIARDSGAGRPYVFHFGRDEQQFVDPYSGELLGEGAAGWREFFRFVTALHRWLALEGEQRELGKAVTGAAALCLAFLTITGLVLWFPKRWTWQHVKRVMAYQPRLHGPARNWNWHLVTGWWLCLPLLIITVTGTVMSYEWANALVYRLAGTEPPAPKATAGGPKGGTLATTDPAALAGLERAWQLAVEKVPAWRNINMRLPSTPGEAATITISASHRGRPDLKTQLTVALASGEERSYETFADAPRGKRWRFWVRWLHTGEAGGILGQTLAAAGTLGAMVLVWTGFALSWRRFRKR